MKLSELQQQLRAAGFVEVANKLDLTEVEVDTIVESWIPSIKQGANNGFWVAKHTEIFADRCESVASFPNETPRELIRRLSYNFGYEDYATEYFDYIIKRKIDKHIALKICVDTFNFWDMGCVQ